MNKFFYIIYNSYYKHGKYKRDIPLATAWGIIVISWASILNCLLTIVSFVIDPYTRSSLLSSTALNVCFVALTFMYYFLFVYNKRYIDIYQRYKNDKFLNSRGAKRLGFGILILSVLSPFIVAVIRQRVVFGTWI